MLAVLDKNGNVVSRSRNLAGIRRHAARNVVKTVAVDRIGIGEGKLCILFENGDNYETNFMSYNVLCWTVRNWVSLRGANLVMNGCDCGEIRYDNKFLVRACL